MAQDPKDSITQAVIGIAANYESENLFMPKGGANLPNRRMIISILQDLRKVMFPVYFEEDRISNMYPVCFLEYTLTSIYERLKEQIQSALFHKHQDEGCFANFHAQADEICGYFFTRLAHIQTALLKDVEAGFAGDPAAKSREEIILSYPGLFAVFVYRIAHELYIKDVPLIPRIMTEYAHGDTGIDINPGAVIGEYFFIDHGTGVVVGETTIIGDHVKLYQGVTLGALSTRSGQKLAGLKRHPTIENHVTIYSGATILGGETVIGEQSIIGGNAFITESVPKFTKASIKTPELALRPQKESPAQDGLWDWVI
ncbi:serine O-acetyltransferase EpsC [Oscillospiraceae bacterium MB08-C2-2]|nr:serine O-acetyltransferase EpsC [Oscillospiraceae bacterium MB08-C2-2]